MKTASISTSSEPSAPAGRMRTYALANHKGGSGKTTTAIHLAGALAALGQRVLLVDLDPQAHATLGLSCEAEDSPCALELLAGEVRAFDALHAAPGGITLIPSHARLAEFEERAARELGSESALARALAPLAERFDICLLDCPPRADGLLTANAIRACDTVLLTVETGAFALQGALKAQEIVDEALAAQRHTPELRVVATMFDKRLNIAREVLIAMQARFGERLFDTAIRSSAKLREAAGAGVPIQVLAPRSSAAQDFAALAQELTSAAVGA